MRRGPGIPKGCFLLAVLATAALAAALPAGAITNGLPDASSANPHPEVGFIVFQNSTGMHIGCSGTLIAPKVFLTAAHCDVTRRATDGLWVSFRPDQPVDENGQAAIPAADRIAGTFVAAPGFTGNLGGQEGSRDAHDIAVVLLAEEATVTPATIAPIGLLSQLGAQNGLRGMLFTNVGYGSLGWVLGSGPPFPEFPGLRLQSISSFQALEQAYLRLSQNVARGLGGTCNGDSGGPQFLGASSHQVVSITVTGDPYCVAESVAYRVDTMFAHAFLSQYLD